MKHVPGHGVTSKDSHKVIPSTNISKRDLSKHFQSFKNFNYLPTGYDMHILFTKKLTQATSQPFLKKLLVK